MPKRGNENAQMKREEYEYMESRGGKRDEDAGEFKRASVAAMAKRRIVSAKRPAKPAGSSAPPAVSNPFANVSFATTPGGLSFGSSTTKDNSSGATKSVGFAAGSTPASEKTSGGFSFGATPAAKPTGSSNAGATPFVFGGGAPAAATPGFSFNSSTDKDEAAGTSTPFSFAAPSPATGGMTFGAPSSSISSGGNARADRFQKHAIELEKCFYQACSKLPVATTNILPVLDQYLDLTYCLESEYWKKANDAAPKPGVSSPVPVPAPAKPAWGSFSSATPTPAPAPATPAPTPAAALGGEPSDTPSDPATKAASGNADEDWETIGSADSQVSFSQPKMVKDENGNESQKNVAITKGQPKFQVNKQTKKKRIIMRNDQTGKVLANMALSSDIPITFRISQDKNKKYAQGIERAMLVGQITPELERGIITLAKRVTDEEHKLETLINKTLSA